MGNTCKSMADSFQCMTKPTTKKKKKVLCRKVDKSYRRQYTLSQLKIYATSLQFEHSTRHAQHRHGQQKLNLKSTHSLHAPSGTVK